MFRFTFVFLVILSFPFHLQITKKHRTKAEQLQGGRNLQNYQKMTFVTDVITIADIPQ